MKPVRNILKDKKSSFALVFYIPVILLCIFVMLIMSSSHGANVQNVKNANSIQQSNIGETIDMAHQIKKADLAINQHSKDTIQIESVNNENN